MKRSIICLAIAAMMLFAMAAPAVAATSGTVYGKAVLSPYSIVVAGTGADSGEPLIYEGDRGATVGEKYGSEFAVYNTGTQSADFVIDLAQTPTALVGEDTWSLSSNSVGPSVGQWMFHDYVAEQTKMVMPVTDPNYALGRVLRTNVPSDGAIMLRSSFQFPTSVENVSDHVMAATISVVAP